MPFGWQGWGVLVCCKEIGTEMPLRVGVPMASFLCGEDSVVPLACVRMGMGPHAISYIWTRFPK